MTEELNDSEHPDTGEEAAWATLPVAAIARSSRRLTLKQAQLWILVLESRYIESRMEPGEYGLRVKVPKEQLDRAVYELQSYLEENRNWPPFLPPTRPMVENTLPTLSVLVLLATFHNLTALELTVLGRLAVDWTEIGSAQAHRILDGEWWRLATSLTLHADWLHLLGNLSIGGFFVVYLCRDLGSGLGWSLLLLAGMLGNLLNAYLQLPSHNSIGASTAVFAAVGCLGAVGVVRYRHQLRRRWPLPVAAALSLLALLGTEGKQTDLGAHLFGFFFGFLLGLAAEWLIGRVGRPGRFWNAVLAAGSAALILAAWWSALKFAD